VLRQLEPRPGQGQLLRQELLRLVLVRLLRRRGQREQLRLEQQQGHLLLEQAQQRALLRRVQQPALLQRVREPALLQRQEPVQGRLGVTPYYSFG